MNTALIILAITNIGTLAVLAYFIYVSFKEKNKTINALISKSSQEFLNHEMADKTKLIPVEPQDLKSDFEEISQLDDNEFEEEVVNPK